MLIICKLYEKFFKVQRPYNNAYVLQGMCLCVGILNSTDVNVITIQRQIPKPITVRNSCTINKYSVNYLIKLKK